MMRKGIYLSLQKQCIKLIILKSENDVISVKFKLHLRSKWIYRRSYFPTVEQFAWHTALSIVSLKPRFYLLKSFVNYKLNILYNEKNFHY